MRLRLSGIIGLALLASILPARAQELTLTLEQTIERARDLSPDAQSARHTLRSAYWNYRYYRANYLPALTLTSDPYLDRAINRVTLDDGSVRFVEQNLLSTDLSLSITQNVALTGGTFFLTTSAQRLDLLSDHTSSWQTSPVMVGYRQSLFGYNSLKWDKRIEPVRYEEARKTYVETLELVAATATQKFFDLATAQSNLEIATTNYAHADTLYAYAQGRYDIGTISENEMLQLEVNKLNEETNCMNARIEVENAMQELRSYLGIREDTDLQVVVDDSIPDFIVNLEEALLLANANSPDILNMQRRQLESESNVANARANAGLKADIYLRFGLTQTGDKLRDAYRDPLDQQYVSLSISLPILDRGTLQPRPGPHPGGTGQDRLPAERAQAGEAVQPARTARTHRGPHRPHRPTAGRGGAQALPAGQVVRAGPQRLRQRERRGTPQLHRLAERILEPVLHPAQPHALRLRARPDAGGRPHD